MGSSKFANTGSLHFKFYSSLPLVFLFVSPMHDRYNWVQLYNMVPSCSLVVYMVWLRFWCCNLKYSFTTVSSIHESKYKVGNFSSFSCSCFLPSFFSFIYYTLKQCGGASAYYWEIILLTIGKCWVFVFGSACMIS